MKNISAQNKFIFFLLFINAINSFGSVLTLLANSTTILNIGGASYVSLMFFLKSIPPVLLGTVLVKKVASHRRLSIAAVSLVISALNVLILYFKESVIGIMIFSVIASISGSFTNTMITSFTSDKFRGDHLRSIFRKQISINSGIFAFAPAAGGYLASQFGTSILYMIDFFTFLKAAALILFCHKFGKQIGEESPPVAPSNSKDDHSNISFVYYLFFPILVFVGLSSVLDALEFPVMGLYLDSKGVGMVLSSWGVGSAIMFIIPPSMMSRISTKFSAIIFFLGITLFSAYPTIFGMTAGFLLAGMAQVVINANLRSEIRDLIEAESSHVIWAKLNQLISGINLASFFSFAIILRYIPTSTAKWIVPAFGIIFVLIVFVWKRPRTGNNSISK